MGIREDALQQLDKLIQTGKDAAGSYSFGEMATHSCTEIPEHQLRAFRAAATATIERLTGSHSEYYKLLPSQEENLQNAQDVIEGALGVLIALHQAVDGGMLVRLEQMVRSNTYDDFLAQADELLKVKPSYHVAAMVLVGGVIEDHIRRMCLSRNIAWTGKGGITAYNNVLKDVVYAQPVWRRIQVVGDHRNAAAHGGPDAAALKQGDVDDDLRFVQKFLADHPA